MSHDHRRFHTLTCILQGNFAGFIGSNDNDTLNPWLGDKVGIWFQITKDQTKCEPWDKITEYTLFTNIRQLHNRASLCFWYETKSGKWCKAWWRYITAWSWEIRNWSYSIHILLVWYTCLVFGWDYVNTRCTGPSIKAGFNSAVPTGLK